MHQVSLASRFFWIEAVSEGRPQNLLISFWFFRRPKPGRGVPPWHRVCQEAQGLKSRMSRGSTVIENHILDPGMSNADRGDQAEVASLSVPLSSAEFHLNQRSRKLGPIGKSGNILLVCWGGSRSSPRAICLWLESCNLSGWSSNLQLWGLCD